MSIETEGHLTTHILTLTTEQHCQRSLHATKNSNPDETRTRNLLIRSQTPYPLGHRVTCIASPSNYYIPLNHAHIKAGGLQGDPPNCLYPLIPEPPNCLYPLIPEHLPTVATPFNQYPYPHC
eukprot:755042-Hanusia_phi.AAC.1